MQKNDDDDGFNHHYCLEAKYEHRRFYQDQKLDAYEHARHILPGWNICTSAQFA